MHIDSYEETERARSRAGWAIGLVLVGFILLAGWVMASAVNSAHASITTGLSGAATQARMTQACVDNPTTCGNPLPSQAQR